MTILECRFDIGGKCRIKPISSEGMIECVRWGISGPMYLVSYWMDGDRKEAWMFEAELE